MDKRSVLHISAVERDTGISKDTLRIWERRYAFPMPSRDAHGERIYSAEEVEKLRLIKRLMDSGHRPGKIVGRPIEDLRSLGAGRPQHATLAQGLDAFVDLIRNHQLLELRRLLVHTLTRGGLQAFILNTVSALNVVVGQAWVDGRIAVFEEHLYSEMMQNLLRNAIATLPQQGSRPRVVLTSLPHEQHSLGLLMAEAMLVIEGAQCIALGTQTPLADIVTAARVHDADIVALSFSASFAQVKAADGLRQLRLGLAPAVQVWAGGAGAARVRKPIEGVQIIGGFEHMTDAIAQWRQAHPSEQ